MATLLLVIGTVLLCVTFLLVGFAHGTRTQRRLDQDSISDAPHVCPVCLTDFADRYEVSP